MDLYLKLKNARINGRISQKTLAEKLGVSRATLSLWECGKATPSILYIRKYQEIFNFEKGYFDDAAGDKISFDISQLNENGVKEMEAFYNSLICNKEYLKKP